MIEVQVNEYGDESVLLVNTFHDVTPPNYHEVTLRQEAIGLNFIDLYMREGIYPAPELPFVPGFEAAGVVIDVGKDISNIQVGDRVCYPNLLGAYTTIRNVPEAKLIVLPSSMNSDIAASIMVKAMTASFLITDTYHISEGDIVLVHAAAGGVGSILCQWAAYLGAHVIGTVSSVEKAVIAKKNGCKTTIVYSEESFPEKVNTITNGRGVDVVYDSVGKITFNDSIKCLRKFGLLVSYGQSSGKIESFDVLKLMENGSLYLTRPTLMHYVDTRESLKTFADRVFSAYDQGVFKLNTPNKYKLSDIKQAHLDLKSRKLFGSTILVP